MLQTALRAFKKNERTRCPHDERDFSIDRKKTGTLGYLRDCSRGTPFFLLTSIAQL